MGNESEVTYQALPGAGMGGFGGGFGNGIVDLIALSAVFGGGLGFGGNRAAYDTAAIGLSDSIQNLNSSVNDIYRAQNQQASDNALAMYQGFSGVTSAIKDCCCESQKTIMAEGAATRGLIEATNVQNLRDQLCAANAKIGALESQKYTDQVIAAQTNVLIHHMNTKP